MKRPSLDMTRSVVDVDVIAAGERRGRRRCRARSDPQFPGGGRLVDQVGPDEMARQRRGSLQLGHRAGVEFTRPAGKAAGIGLFIVDANPDTSAIRREGHGRCPGQRLLDHRPPRPPHADPGVVACGHDRVAARGEHAGTDAVFMPPEHQHLDGLPVGVEPPQARRSVVARRQQNIARRVEAQAGDATRMTAQRPDGRRSVHHRHANGVICSRSREVLSVGTPRERWRVVQRPAGLVLALGLDCVVVGRSGGDSRCLRPVARLHHHDFAVLPDDAEPGSVRREARPLHAGYRIERLLRFVRAVAPAMFHTSAFHEGSSWITATSRVRS